MLKIQKLGIPGGDAFLLSDDSTAFLLDSGFAFSGLQLAEQIRAALGTQPLDAILLTHSHYDHAGGAMQVKNLFPNAKNYAHEYAVKVFGKPGAKRTMREMDSAEAEKHGITAYEDLFDELQADCAVQDGDEIRLGRYTFRVLHLPGHTRCSVGYWCAEERLLLASETLGVPACPGVVSPTYLVGYQITLDAIDLVSALPVEHIVLPHTGCLDGCDACREFLRTARHWAVEAHDRVHALHRAGETDQACIELLRTLFYTPETALVQPVKAFELNARYMVPMLLKEP